MHNSDFFNKAIKMLTPPGCGVFTVNTAKEHKNKLHNKIYSNAANVEQCWLESLTRIKDTNLLMFGICSDSGGGIQRGANWGPLYLRLYLSDYYYNSVMDIGDIKVIPHLLHDKYLTPDIINSCRAAIYKDISVKLPVSPLSIAESICQIIYTNFSKKKLLVLGGDHSVSYPLLKSYLLAKQAILPKIAVIHFDAHTDLMSTRMGLDYCFATWANKILADLSDPSNLVQIGIRSSAQSKTYWQQELGVSQFWANEIVEDNAAALAQSISDGLLAKGVQEVYISFDVDVLDASLVGATGTPEPFGLSVASCQKMLSVFRKNFVFGGADIVEVAPFVSYSANQANQEDTLINSVAILQSLIDHLK